MSYFFSTSAYIFGLTVFRMNVRYVVNFLQNPLKGSRAEAEVKSGMNWRKLMDTFVLNYY